MTAHRVSLTTPLTDDRRTVWLPGYTSSSYLERASAAEGPEPLPEPPAGSSGRPSRPNWT